MYFITEHKSLQLELLLARASSFNSKNGGNSSDDSIDGLCHEQWNNMI